MTKTIQTESGSIIVCATCWDAFSTEKDARRAEGTNRFSQAIYVCRCVKEKK